MTARRPTRGARDEPGDLPEEAVGQLRAHSDRLLAGTDDAHLLRSVDAVGPDGILLPLPAATGPGGLTVPTAAGPCSPPVGSSGDIRAALNALEDAGLPDRLSDALAPLRDAARDSLRRELPVFVQ